jgi:hypothetical protein
LQITAGSAAGAWSDPTVVYVDSVTVTGATVPGSPWEFATSAAPLAINFLANPVDGSNLMWRGPG